jgi:transcriptional regulator with XRE-family HTH domain
MLHMLHIQNPIMKSEKTLRELIDDAVSSGRWTRSSLALAMGIHRTQLWRLENGNPTRSKAAVKLRILLGEDEMIGIEGALRTTLRKIIQGDLTVAQEMLRMLHILEEIARRRGGIS